MLELKTSSPIGRYFLSTWKLIFFTLFCLFLYEQGQKRRDFFYNELNNRLAELQEEMDNTIQLNQELLLQMNSQSDPAFIELTLMKILGTVPEGQTKFYFRHHSSPHQNFSQLKYD